MSMINFNGKLVLDCQKPGSGTEQQFMQNAHYLDTVLRANGYQKTDIDNNDSRAYISAL